MESQKQRNNVNGTEQDIKYTSSKGIPFFFKKNNLFILVGG